MKVEVYIKDKVFTFEGRYVDVQEIDDIELVVNE